MRNFARDMIRMLPVVVVTVIVFLTILFIAMPKQNPYLKAEEPDYTGVSDVISLQKVNTGEVRASNIRQENYLTINSAYITHNINLLVYRILISIYRNLEDDPVIQYLSKVYPDFNQFFDNMKGKMYLEKFLIRTEDKIEIIDNAYVKLFMERDYKEIISIFNKSNGRIKEPELRYVIAYSLFKLDEYQEAIALFESISKDDLLYYDYVLYYKAYAYMQNDDYEKAGKTFRELRLSFPSFRYMADVVNTEASCYVKNDYSDSIFTELEELNTSYYRYLNLLLCKSYYKAEKYDKAVYYASLVVEKGISEQVEQVVPILTDIYSKRGRITYADKYRLAKAYFSIYEYHKAKELLEQVSFRDEDMEYERLNYLASLNWRMKYKQDALEIYQELVDNYSGYKKDKAEYHIAQLLISMDKMDEAYSRLLSIANDRKHNFRKGSLFLLLDILKERKDYRSMFKYLKTLSTRYNTKFDTWHPYVVPMINAHEFEMLVDEFSGYIKVANNHRFISQLYFWLGQSYEGIKRWDDAYRAYEKSVEHYNNHYYPNLSLKRIEELHISYLKGEIELNHPKSPQQIEHEINERLEDFLDRDVVKNRIDSYIDPNKVNLNEILNKQGRKAIALIRSGDIENGFDEWRDYYRSINKGGEYALYFMNLFYNSGLYNRSLFFAESIVDHLNYGTYRNQIPPYLLTFMYPDYFKEYVEEISDEHKVDKNLVYAVIREESRFHHLAKSWAGAEGLMQIMPSTGKWLVDKLNRDSYKPFNPYENIYLGTGFLKELLEDFDSPLAVGAYNAGGGRMGRYVKEFYKDIDIINLEHFVENIPIKETRYYIIKVMGAYSVYERLYK